MYLRKSCSLRQKSFVKSFRINENVQKRFCSAFNEVETEINFDSG